MDKREIAKVIKKSFIDLDIRQVDAANELGITESAVSKCISGDFVSPSFDAYVLLKCKINLRKLRKSTGVTASV